MFMSAASAPTLESVLSSVNVSGIQAGLMTGLKVGLPVMVTFLGIRKGISFFKSMITSA